MRHRVAGHHLGRSSSQRRALFRSLIRELYLHERIVTTDAKARAVRADAEKLITKAKAGVATDGNRVHAQRQVVAYLNDMTVAKKVFDVFAPRYAVPAGGLYAHHQAWPALGRWRRYGDVGTRGCARSSPTSGDGQEEGRQEEPA